MQVVLDHRQISMFSYAQAAAVTDPQLAALSDVQRMALAMVLTPREDRLVDFRGENPFQKHLVFQGHLHFFIITHVVRKQVRD